MNMIRRHRWRCFFLAATSLISAGALYQWHSRPTLVITRDTCAKIREGMTEADVSTLVGGPAGEYATRPTLYGEHNTVGQTKGDATKKWDKEYHDSIYTRAWSDNQGSIAVFFEKRDGRVARWFFASMASHKPGLVACWLMLPSVVGLGAARERACDVEFEVLEKQTSKPVPCRIHVRDQAGRPQRADDLPFWRDHFVCPGSARLRLTPGDYTYEVERGLEYAPRTGTFTVKHQAAAQVRLGLERRVDLAWEGWWSGELHVHRPVADMELLMRAEDLHVAPVITWWNERNEWARKPLPDDPLVRFDGDRYYHVLAGEDEREGGALLYFNLRKPLGLAGSGREHPSPMKFVAEARRQKDVWIDIEKPFWWDVPVWLASGQIDSIGLANNHMCRGKMFETEAWGKPRDVRRLPPPLGNGFWTQEIYYHVLNCGLRIPPSAGSASGVLPNPVGYDRVYVHVDGAFSYEKWWEGLRAGRSFVTNGPLPRVRVNNELPGHVFSGPEGKEIDLEVEVALTSGDRVRSLEVIKNGGVERTMSHEEWVKAGTLGHVHFTQSGWFLVRVIADNAKTFRFASTAPYYVEIGEGKRRVSKASARFFLDWVGERAKRVKLEDEAQRQEVLRHHADARKFWEEILTKATAE
jgi:hypothetical protein